MVMVLIFKSLVSKVYTYIYMQVQTGGYIWATIGDELLDAHGIGMCEATCDCELFYCFFSCTLVVFFNFLR